MYDALCVGRRERTRQLQRDLDHLCQRDRSRPEKRAERGAGDMLADEVQLAGDLVEREHGRDVRVRQRRGRPRLLPQPFAPP